MGEHRRKADGRRVFSTEFKRETIQRILTGEKTLAELGLVPITTPAYSPESNGLAEAFVGTFKRDYVSGAELRDAETVLAQLGGWFDDYNTSTTRQASKDLETK